MSRMFGGRDPFDDPFFTRPLGSFFGSSMFDSGSSFGNPPQANRSRGPIIEELDSDVEREVEEERDINGAGEKDNKFNENAWANNNPLVEHPEDQADGNSHGKGNSRSKEVSYRSDYNKAEGAQPQMRSASFQRVTYGGIDGAYYTATTTRRTGSDGITLEETKQADRTTGEATHRLSRGIHDKGHSYTRKLNQDGKVDTTQTLHNLNEDELASFEQAWKGNADSHLAGWDNGFDLFQNSGTVGSGRSDLGKNGGWALPFRESFRRFGSLGPYHDADAQANSSRGRPKKVVRINIE